MTRKNRKLSYKNTPEQGLIGVSRPVRSRPCSILIESKLGPNLLFYRDFRAVKCSISLEITLIFGKPDLHFTKAVDEAGVDPLDVSGDVNLHTALGHFFQQDTDLQFGQPCADTAVDAIAEGQMTPRIFTFNVDLVGIFKNALVTVGRNIPHDKLVA